MSLVAFKAQNHPQQESIDSVDDRGTRRDFFDPLNAQHRFTIDVAASDANALLPRYFTKINDGLAQTWAGERVWCNPPYSAIAAWPEKAWIEMVDGTCEIVAMLLPANRCEQPWWQTHVEPYRDRAPFHGVSLRVDFLPGRMRFVMPADYALGNVAQEGRSTAVRLHSSDLESCMTQLTSCPTCNGRGISGAPFDVNCPAAWAHRCIQPFASSGQDLETAEGTTLAFISPNQTGGEQ